MKKSFLLSVLLIVIAINSMACLNIYYSVDKEGHFHETENYRDKFRKNFDNSFLESILPKTEAKLRKEKSYELLSDYAVYLMKAGKLEESLEILVSLSKAQPGEYEIAANLGTAYELSGNPDSALVYIKRGIELNPKAHGGSEWVHVKILETKILLRDQTDYLSAHTVLELTSQQEKDIKILDQLLIQLRERFPFSPEGDDPIMASLFVDLGDCYANSISIEYARAYYELAQKYYGDKSSETADKIKEMERLSEEYQTLNTKFTENGENNKEERRPYNRVMEDSPGSDEVIDWSKINTNVDTLLSFVGLERVIAAPVDTAVEVAVAPVAAADASPVEERAGSMVWIILVLGAGAVLIAVIYFVKKRK